MKQLTLFTIPLLLFCLFLTPAKLRAQEENQYAERHIAILSAYKTFDEAKADAEKISKASQVPFSMMGRVYDKKLGLIYPADEETEVMKAEDFPRLYDTTVIKEGEEETPFLSVEKSDAYEGFAPGFYIVVAGINETRDLALKRAEKFKTWASTAYVKKSKLYMGCRH